MEHPQSKSIVNSPISKMEHIPEISFLPPAIGVKFTFTCIIFIAFNYDTYVCFGKLFHTANRIRSTDDLKFTFVYLVTVIKILKK